MSFFLRVRQRLNPFSTASKQSGGRSALPKGGNRKARLLHRANYSAPKISQNSQQYSSENEQDKIVELSARLAMDDIAEFNAERARGNVPILSSQNITPSNDSEEVAVPGRLGKFTSFSDAASESSHDDNVLQPDLESPDTIATPKPASWVSPLDGALAQQRQWSINTATDVGRMSSDTIWDPETSRAQSPTIDFTNNSSEGSNWMADQINRLSYEQQPTSRHAQHVIVPTTD